MVRHRLTPRLHSGSPLAAIIILILVLAGCSWMPWMKNDEEVLHPAADVPAGRTVDPQASFVVFSGQVGSDSYQGKFQNIEGNVLLRDGVGGETLHGGALQLRIPVASLRTQHDALTARLLGAEFFDGGGYPYIDFHSTDITAEPEGTYLITGQLSFRGKEKTLHLEAKLENNILSLNTIVDRGDSRIDSLQVASAIPAEARITLR